MFLDWENDDRVQTFISLDELGMPWTCGQWADNSFSGGLYDENGDPVSPQIIDDGNSPERVIWNWFDYSLAATYPKNVFIDHEMKVHAITEIDMTSEAVNEIINEMLSNAPSGCTDDTACNYDSSAFNDDGSCELPIEGCNCDSIDTDSDGVCDQIDDCPSIYNPFQHDRDQDGLADACNDDDDDGDGLVDCWNYWYDDGIQMTSDEITAEIASGACGDFTLSNENFSIPKSMNLLSSHPNPFNPSTTISFYLDSPGITNINIYDLDGKKMNNLARDFYESGYHTIMWNPDITVSSGVYLVSLVHNNKTTLSHKLLYLK